MSENFSPGEEPRILVETVGKPVPGTNEINESSSSDSPLARLKKYSGRLAATALLSTTLLLSACSDVPSDCIPASAPPTPAPGSAGFTAAQPSSGSSGTYCRSRTTGGYYYSGGGYYGGGSS